MEGNQEDDAAGRLYTPQRDGGEEDEAMVNKRDDHEHDNRDEEKPACPNLVAPFVRHLARSSLAHAEAESERRPVTRDSPKVEQRGRGAQGDVGH